MTPEQNVTSFEMSKAIEEAGIKLDTYFVWHIPLSKRHPYITSIRTIDGTQQISAPTASELGEILPEYIPVDHYLSIHKQMEGWIVSYGEFINREGQSIAEGMGQMALFLKQSGYWEGK